MDGFQKTESDRKRTGENNAEVNVADTEGDVDDGNG
jgi:hypothetical protein